MLVVHPKVKTSLVKLLKSWCEISLRYLTIHRLMYQDFPTSSEDGEVYQPFSVPNHETTIWLVNFYNTWVLGNKRKRLNAVSNRNGSMNMDPTPGEKCTTNDPYPMQCRTLYMIITFLPFLPESRDRKGVKSNAEM